MESLTVWQGVEGGHFVLASTQRRAYRNLGFLWRGPAQGQTAFLSSFASHNNLGISRLQLPQEHQPHLARRPRVLGAFPKMVRAWFSCPGPSGVPNCGMAQEGSLHSSIRFLSPRETTGLKSWLFAKSVFDQCWFKRPDHKSTMRYHFRPISGTMNNQSSIHYTCNLPSPIKVIYCYKIPCMSFKLHVAQAIRCLLELFPWSLESGVSS